jgi:hypothetical protein
MHNEVEQAFARIEEAVLPSLTVMLDSLLDAASLARPGVDAETYAADLRRFAGHLQTLTCRIERGSHSAAISQPPYRAASAA